MKTVIYENLKVEDINVGEVLRYLGCPKTEDELTLQLIDRCISEAENAFSFKLCYAEYDLKILNEVCDLGDFKLCSKSLKRVLDGCDKALIFAATIGVGIDRLITRYSDITPSRAVVFDALGSERIEALCDSFCREYEQQNGVFLTPRFSPGYGDLPLYTQKDIFFHLDCPKSIGVTLNDSLLMSPTKSVTAIAGIRRSI